MLGRAFGVVLLICALAVAFVGTAPADRSAPPADAARALLAQSLRT